MKRTQIQLTEEQVERLKKLASSRHLSVAELIRQAVDKIIKSDSSIDFDVRRERAIAIAGKFGSGKRDGSRDHDKHLSEAFKE